MKYKDQNSVESTFKVLKSPSYVDTIFLNKLERIEAFGYITVLAVLLINLIERRICENLKPESEEINLLGRRKTFSLKLTKHLVNVQMETLAIYEVLNVN